MLMQRVLLPKPQNKWKPEMHFINQFPRCSPFRTESVMPGACVCHSSSASPVQMVMKGDISVPAERVHLKFLASGENSEWDGEMCHLHRLLWKNPEGGKGNLSCPPGFEMSPQLSLVGHQTTNPGLEQRHKSLLPGKRHDANLNTSHL